MFTRTQAYDHFPRLAKQAANVLYNAEDGTVWAGYRLTGLNTNPYDLTKVTACQRGNGRLFTALSNLPITDGLLLGLKGQTDPEVIMARCSAGIPNLTSQNYPELREQFDAFHKRIETGELAEHTREFILCLGFPTRQSKLDKLLSSLAVVNPHRAVNPAMIEELETRYFEAIPPEFTATRLNAEELRWAFNRARLRAITVPVVPTGTDAAKPRTAVSSPRSFPPVMINKNADTDALYEDFLTRAAKADPRLTSRGEHRVPRLPITLAAVAGLGAAAASLMAVTAVAAVLALLAVIAIIVAAVKVGASAGDSRKLMRDSFPSTRWSRVMSVHDIQTRSTEFPDGYTSYQTMISIARYPTAESFGVNAFTYLADQDLGGDIDCDWAMRFDFSQNIVTKKGMRKLRKEIDAEDASNTEDELDAEDYADQRDELRALRAAVKSDPGPRGMRAAFVFAFASQNMKILTDAVDDAMEHFVEHGFTPVLPVGGQFDLWQAMMPGSSCPPVLEDLKAVSTTRLMGAFMPVRRTTVGDPRGMPIAINKENGLGQIVHRDFLHATDRGNGSIAMIGAPNAGKSQLLKVIAGYMADLKRPVHLIDQDPDGEMTVFAHSVTDPQVVHVTEPHRSIGGGSLDPLKCYPPEHAAGEFLRLWLPLLGITRDTDEGAAKAELLSLLVSPEYRASARITSTRDLIARLKGGQGGITHAHSGSLAIAFDFWARQPYTAAFIDPEIGGSVVEYAPFSAQKLLVVFRTHHLRVNRPTPGQAPREDTEEELFATMALTAIARLTTWRFYNTVGSCMFGGDELKFLKGGRVLQELIEQPDRMGRKGANFVVVAAQLASDLDEHTGAIECKVALRQGTEANAAAALNWEGLPVTERMIKRMVEDTSPLDPHTNLPALHRRGEGWYNDGTQKAFVQVLDHFLARRRRYSNTEASTRIFDRDLVAAAGSDPTAPR